jgi:uncharacterized C2H2 Zn-finger protein
MVRVKKKDGKVYFKCEECGMYYLSREIAQRCENFCKRYNGCDTEIIKHAVELGK